MVNSNEIRQMLTVREVARLLHIHTNTVRRWSDQGILKGYRIASRGDRRFIQEDVAQFITRLYANGGDERKAHLDYE